MNRRIGMTKEGKKKQFRTDSLKRLKKASGLGSYQKDKKIVHALYQYIVENNAKNVMLYVIADISPPTLSASFAVLF